MCEIFRKFPFAVILPFFAAGIHCGSSLSMGSGGIAATAGILAILLITAGMERNFSVFEIFIPFFYFFIGILLSDSCYMDFTVLFPEEALQILEHIKTGLKAKNSRIFSNDEIAALVNALCLGDKSGILKERYKAFADSGTIHLLAVSGLHTGAVFLMTLFFFRSLRISKRYSSILTLAVIWLYALLTGLSPSVVRAAMILTFLTCGGLAQKDCTSINGIAACAFFTLIFKPENLYNISFQLSYSAYTGIILLLPRFSPRKQGNRIAAYLQTGIALSIASQLAVLPLTIYYFHYVSLNSFLVNLLAVPLATCMLYADIAALLLPERISLMLSDLLEIPGNLLFSCIDLFNTSNIHIADAEVSVSLCAASYLIIIGVLSLAFIRPVHIIRKKIFSRKK